MRNILGRQYIRKLGIPALQQRKIQGIRDIFSGVKTLLVHSKENIVEKFKAPAKKFALLQAEALTLVQLPRFFVEGFCSWRRTVRNTS